ncbi:hypothetical protein V6N13_114286 [Hibiscus sabdariffa]
MDGRLLHPRAENRDVKYWSESNQYASGDSLPAGYVSRYIETAHVSVRQNDLEELKQIWEDLSRADRQAFVDKYGDIAYLLYVQVNEPMLRALIKFWNPGYRCFTLNSIDLMPTVEEYSELLRVPNIIEDRIYTKPKRNTNMPAQLVAFTVPLRHQSCTGYSSRNVHFLKRLPRVGGRTLQGLCPVALCLD